MKTICYRCCELLSVFFSGLLDRFFSLCAAVRLADVYVFVAAVSVPILVKLPQGVSQKESEIQLITELVGEEAAKRYLERHAAVWQAMVEKHQGNRKAAHTDADAGAEDSEEG